MKKSYFLMAVAATMFAACSQSDVLNEVQEQDEAQAIGFSTYSSKATRAENNNTSVNVSDLEEHHGNFKVWGYKNTYTDGFVFGGETVSEAAGSTWTYTEQKYWDKAATNYHFYAAAPANAAWSLIQVNGAVQDDDYFCLVNFALVGKSLTSTTFENSFKGSEDVDLMIASPCKVERANFGNTVQLNFNHILSRLNVTVKKGTNIANETLDITSFKVCNLKKAGNFDESADLGTDVLTAGTTKRWAVADYKYEITGNTASNVEAEQYIFQALVIPQAAAWENVERDGSSTETAPYFTIEYTIDGEPYSATYNLSEAFADADGMALYEGYQNTLHLTIDADAIVFDASVYEWTDKNEKDFDIE